MIRFVLSKNMPGCNSENAWMVAKLEARRILSRLCSTIGEQSLAVRIGKKWVVVVPKVIQKDK